MLSKEETKAAGADRAYDSDLIRTLILAAGKEAVSPPRADRVERRASRKVYPGDVSDEAWKFVVSYLTLLREDVPQRV